MKTVLLIFLCYFLSPVAVPVSESWLQQGGDSSHAGGSGTIPARPFLRWKTPNRAPFYTPPSIMGDFLLIGDGRGNLGCFRRSNGREVWDRRTSGYYAGAPVGQNGRVYAACARREQWQEKSYSGGLFSSRQAETISMVSEKSVLSCYRLKDGMKLWSRRFPKLIHGTPALSEGRLVVATTGNKIYCLDADQGRELWELKAEGPIVSSPVISSGRVLVGALDGGLYCLSLDNGSLLWRHKGDSPIRVAPAVARGGVFSVSVDGVLRCFALGPGKQIWEKELGSKAVTSPVIWDTFILLACSDRSVRCLQGGDGRQLWRIKDLNGLPRSLAALDGKLVVGTDAGKLGVFLMENGQEVWNYDLVRKNAVLASAGGGEIYVATPDQALYCVTLADKEGGLRFSRHNLKPDSTQGKTPE